MKKLLFTIAIAAVACGCGKSVDVNGRGMYVNSSTGVIGMGEFEVVTNPEGADGARIHYEEDTAWLSPTVKTHEFKASLSGTNACEAAARIVSDICDAFAINTNRVTDISR